jgi:hypothetical protein
MPMIQGIDGNALINALRAGRQDRAAYDEQQMKIAQAKKAQERQDQISGLEAQLFGKPAQPASGGVMGNFAPSAPQTVQPETGAPTMPAPTGMAPTRPQVNQDVLSQLLVLDPESYGKLAASLKTMDEAQIKREAQRNDTMASAAMYLQKMPPQARAQAFRRILPQMMAAGWTQQELANADLSDEALMGYRAFGLDYEKALAADLKEREFRAGKTVPVTAGGSVALVKPTMDAAGNLTGTSQEYIIGGPGGGATTTPTDLPKPASKKDYDNLTPGQKYLAPDGTVRTKPGGQPGGSGPFAQ